MNDTTTDNRNAPSYLAHYGMHRAPFAERLTEDMYFSTPTHTQRLDILLHLTQYSDELLLVVGNDGIGKTTILNQFVNRATRSWKICQISAHPLIDEEQLALRISHGFNLPVEVDDLESMYHSLKRYLDGLLTTTQTVVLLIDNAHQLGQGCLRRIMEISQLTNKSNEGRVRTLLFCEPSIKIQLASSQLEHLAKRQTQRKIDIPPLTEEQTGQYIHHRLTVAGFETDNIFTETAVAKIYRQSGGLPGMVSELAHNVLFDMTPVRRRIASKEQDTEAPAERPKRLGGMIAAALVALGIVSLLLFQKEINDLYTGTEKSALKQSDLVTENSPIALPDITTQNPLNDQADYASGQGIDEQTLNALAELADDIANTPPTPTPSPEPIVEPIAEPIAEPEPMATAPIAAATSPKPVKKPKTVPAMAISNNYQSHMERLGVKQEPWILEQQDSHFTIQVLAGYKLSSVDRFVKLYPKLTKNLAYFYSQNKGKDWHSLVYGVYPDYASAQAASKKLTRQARKIKPWIRRVKSIQKDINPSAG